MQKNHSARDFFAKKRIVKTGPTGNKEGGFQLLGSNGLYGAAMQWDANTQLSLAAVTMAGMALVISLFAAFPGLKGMFSVVRDGVLWLAMLIILSGAGFVVYQRLQHTPMLTQRPAWDGLSTREPAPRPMIPEPRQP